MNYLIKLIFDDGSTYDKMAYTYETNKNQIKIDLIGSYHEDDYGEYKIVRDALVKDAYVMSTITPELCWN